MYVNGVFSTRSYECDQPKFTSVFLSFSSSVSLIVPAYET